MPVNFNTNNYNYQNPKSYSNTQNNSGVYQQNTASGQTQQAQSLEQLFNQVDSLQLGQQQDSVGDQQQQNPIQMFMDKMKEMLGMDKQQANETEGGDNNKKAEGTKGKKGEKSKGGPPPGGTELLSFLSSLGLSPSGSKESDYTQVMNHLESLENQAGQDKSQKQYAQSMKQKFLALYATL